MSTLKDAGYVVMMPAAKINSMQAEVDDLRAEVERLRSALGKIARVNACDYEYQQWARAALGEKT